MHPKVILSQIGEAQIKLTWRGLSGCLIYKTKEEIDRIFHSLMTVFEIVDLFSGSLRELLPATQATFFEPCAFL